MTREQMIEIMDKHGYIGEYRTDKKLCMDVDRLGYVEYEGEIINLLDIEQCNGLHDEIVEEIVDDLEEGPYWYQRLFDRYVELHFEKYNERYLISERTGRITY